VWIKPGGPDNPHYIPGGGEAYHIFAAMAAMMTFETDHMFAHNLLQIPSQDKKGVFFLKSWYTKRMFWLERTQQCMFLCGKLAK